MVKCCLCLCVTGEHGKVLFMSLCVTGEHGKVLFVSLFDR